MSDIVEGLGTPVEGGGGMDVIATVQTPVTAALVFKHERVLEPGTPASFDRDAQSLWSLFAAQRQDALPGGWEEKT